MLRYLYQAHYYRYYVLRPFHIQARPFAQGDPLLSPVQGIIRTVGGNFTRFLSPISLLFPCNMSKLLLLITIILISRHVKPLRSSSRYLSQSLGPSIVLCVVFAHVSLPYYSRQHLRNASRILPFIFSAGLLEVRKAVRSKFPSIRSECGL